MDRHSREIDNAGVAPRLWDHRGVTDQDPASPSGRPVAAAPVPTPPAPLDTVAAEHMWSEYAAAHPEVASTEHTVDRFGDSGELSDELLALVLNGAKRATADLVAEFAARGEALPRVGSHWVVCDGAGVPRAVLQSTELRLGTIGDADEAFARDEGEDDLTLQSWLRGHRRYWERTSAARGEAFTDQHEIVFERFRVVWPPQVTGMT